MRGFGVDWMERVDCLKRVFLLRDYCTMSTTYQIRKFINKGHLLIVPKIEVDHIFDLEDEIYLKLWSVAKMLAKPLKKLTNAK
jgi:hypothetical protein